MNPRILKYVIGNSITPSINQLMHTILTSKIQKYPIKHLDKKTIEGAERLGLIVTDGDTASLTDVAGLFLDQLFDLAKNEGVQ